MSVEHRIEQLVNGMQKLNAIVAKYPGPGFTDGIYGYESAPFKPETLQRDASAMAQEGRNLRVGIIGRVKAGKSSLLNALMFAGKDVLPKAATPMTASLTVLRYTEQNKPYAEVEYFLPEDVKDMRLLAEEYDERFQVALAERQKTAEEKAARPGARTVPKPDPERLKKSVKNELDADPRLGGAKDIYERIKNAGGLPSNEAQRIEGHDLADLQTKLADYVGADGQFTPFTKCLTLFLPLPSLQGVDLVDTPGVNDPIRSREERTMEELHNCDVVFVVSPSGQFLNQQDLELMGRLTYKDGVREVFLVASQIDGQLFGSERDKHDGRLPDVLQGLRRTLAGQAGSALGAVPTGNQGLDILRNQLAERLVVTSSVAFALSTQQESEWDENARHTWSLLNSSYPAECAQIASAKTHLDAMAGIVQTEFMLGQVRERKQAITEDKISAFLDDQAKAYRGYLDGAPEVVSRNREEIVNAKMGDLEDKLSAMQGFRDAAVRVTNVAVGDIAEDAAGRLRDLLNNEIEKLFSQLKNTAEKSKDSEVEYFTVKKSGILPGLARLFGVGGTERRSETVATINATEIRSALQDFHDVFSGKLIFLVDKTRLGLRKEIESGILATLREHKVVNDREIDSTRLAQACRAVLAEVRDFDAPELPSLPSKLMQNGTLKGGDARSYESAALEYLEQLKKASSKEARTLPKDFEARLKATDVGNALFAHYEEHLNGVKAQIQDRDKTLQRYDELLVELKELRNHA